MMGKGGISSQQSLDSFNLALNSIGSPQNLQNRPIGNDYQNHASRVLQQRQMLLNQYNANRPYDPDESKPDWFKSAKIAVLSLKLRLEENKNDKTLDWQIVKHDYPLLREAYDLAPEAPETKMAADALKAAAERGISRLKEQKIAKGIIAAEVLLSRVARVFR